MPPLICYCTSQGVSEEEIEGIDTKGGSSQEKCYTSLERWQDKLGDSATITSLAKFLRESNQERLSRTFSF